MPLSKCSSFFFLSEEHHIRGFPVLPQQLAKHSRNPNMPPHELLRCALETLTAGRAAHNIDYAAIVSVFSVNFCLGWTGRRRSLFTGIDARIALFELTTEHALRWSCLLLRGLPHLAEAVA